MGRVSFKKVPCAWKVVLKWDTWSFYSTQLRSNLSNKQEVMCQDNSLVTQVDFVCYLKLLLALFCTQTDIHDRLTSMTWTATQVTRFTDISVTALPPITTFVIREVRYWTLTGCEVLEYTEHPASSLFTFLGPSSISTKAPLYPRMLLSPKRSQATRKATERTKKWCLSISKVV